MSARDKLRSVVVLVTGIVGTFCGPQVCEAAGHLTDHPDHADLIYDVATGAVTLDATEAAGGVITNFVLKNAAGGDDFNAPGVAVFPFAGVLKTDLPVEISQTDGTLTGFAGQHNLGGIFPTGFSLNQLEGFLTRASYVGLVGTGNPEFDLKLFPGAASARVVNIDLEAGAVGDTTHVGDDGPLSTAGGTIWTSVASGVNATDLQDEFGGASPVDVVFPGPGAGTTFTDAGINNLQDSGTTGTIQIADLLPGETYLIAAYVGANGGFILKDGTGTNGFFFGNPGADGWSLPGTEGDGGDYFLAKGVVPFDLGGGVFGVEFQLDGAVTGLQISGVVPEPSGIVLLGVTGLALICGRRKSRRTS